MQRYFCKAAEVSRPPVQVHPFHSKRALNAACCAKPKQKCVVSSSSQCSHVHLSFRIFFTLILQQNGVKKTLTYCTFQWCSLSHRILFYFFVGLLFLVGLVPRFPTIILRWPEVKPHTSIGAESTLSSFYILIYILLFFFCWFWQSVHTKSIKCTQILQQQCSSTSTELAAWDFPSWPVYLWPHWSFSDCFLYGCTATVSLFFVVLLMFPN